MRKYKVSIVVPVYHSEKTIRPFYERLINVLNSITDDFLLIFVNDFSPDNSLQVLKELAHKDKRVGVLSFSRNFGQHYAISAGLDFAYADWYIVMDCDLQDRPEEIQKLYCKTKEGFDVILAARESRRDSRSKVLSSYFFYKIFNLLTGLEADEKVTNFGMYSYKVIENIRLFKEQTRSFPLFVKWMGFRTVKVPIEHDFRYEGRSSYTLKKLLTLAFDIIISHSNTPLKISVALGGMISLSSLAVGAFLFVRYFWVGSTVQGWTSLFVSISFFSGIILFFQGLLGIYIGKIYNETKGRPLYVIDERIGL